LLLKNLRAVVFKDVISHLHNLCKIKTIMKIPASDLIALESLIFTTPLILFAPFVCCLCCYFYHFQFRNHNFKVRTDTPTKAHREDWKTSLFRPEASGVVVCYALGVGIFCLTTGFEFLLPLGSFLDWSIELQPLKLFLLFFVLDFSMYCVHFAQHKYRWLYHRTHAIHHEIRCPTILVALTGHFPDTMLLVLFPLHFTYCIVPTNLITVSIFSAGAMFHLHAIHSEFKHAWDEAFGALGIVNTYDHHVHHLRPRKNLAHFFIAIDKVFGTYKNPKDMKELVFEN